LTPPGGRPVPPPEIVELAQRRGAAREAQDWAVADELRTKIDAAGWKVIDVGRDFRLEAAHPPTVRAGDVVLYGRTEEVPSRLAEPAIGVATVVVVAAADPAPAIRAIAGLIAHVAAGTSIVVVADGLSDASAALLDAALDHAADGEVVRTSARLGHAAGLNAGIRRAGGRVVVVLDPSVEPTGDVVTPLVQALDEPDVAVAGPIGLASGDLRHFDEVEQGPAAAIEGSLMAFRRADATDRGPLDEGFRFYRHLDAWWSLVLRDEGEDEASRRALVVPGLPFTRAPNPAWTEAQPARRERLQKRNAYRVLNRFGWRHDLAVEDPRIGSNRA
jgi:hypothetical protein